MFCPECRTEYVEEISVCADCGALLVPELPTEAESEWPENVGFQEILATFNAGDIAIIKSLLDSENIDYYFHGEFFNYIEPLVQPARLMIRADQVQEARGILKDLEIEYTLGSGTKEWTEDTG